MYAFAYGLASLISCILSSALLIGGNSQRIVRRQRYFPKRTTSVIDGTLLKKLIVNHGSAVAINVTSGFAISCIGGFQFPPNIDRVFNFLPFRWAFVLQATQVSN